jgi:hypothetical protein
MGDRGMIEAEPCEGSLSEAVGAVAFVYGPFEETGQANARLIAASPDMWLVCERLRQWWMEHGIEENKELDAVVDLARSALAKVEGDVKG